MDYKMFSCLIMAGKSDCVLEHPVKASEMSTDVSAVTCGNQGELVGSYGILSLSYSTMAEVRDCPDPAKISVIYTVAISKHYKLLFQPALSYSALAEIGGMLQQVLQISLHVKGLYGWCLCLQSSIRKGDGYRAP